MVFIIPQTGIEGRLKDVLVLKLVGVFEIEIVIETPVTARSMEILGIIRPVQRIPVLIVHKLCVRLVPARIIAEGQLAAAAVVTQVKTVVEPSDRNGMFQIDASVEAVPDLLGNDVQHRIPAAVPYGRQVVILYLTDLLRTNRLQLLCRSRDAVYENRDGPVARRDGLVDTVERNLRHLVGQVEARDGRPAVGIGHPVNGTVEIVGHVRPHDHHIVYRRRLLFEEIILAHLIRIAQRRPSDMHGIVQCAKPQRLYREQVFALAMFPESVIPLHVRYRRFDQPRGVPHPPQADGSESDRFLLPGRDLPFQYNLGVHRGDIRRNYEQDEQYTELRFFHGVQINFTCLFSGTCSTSRAGRRQRPAKEKMPDTSSCLFRFAYRSLSEELTASCTPRPRTESLNIPGRILHQRFRNSQRVIAWNIYPEIENAGIIRRIRIAQVVIVYADNILSGHKLAQLLI